MAENSKIEWTDSTWNPWIGCTKVSGACDHCYAEALSKRHGWVEWGGPRKRTSAANWKKPLQWNRAAEAFAAEHGRRQRVFCASLADVFDNQVPAEWRADLWALIDQCRSLDWLLLTKRPQNICKMLPGTWGKGWPQVWLGTTAEDQTEADRRIPHLLKVPAVCRFVSYEPALGPVRLKWSRMHADNPRFYVHDWLTGQTRYGQDDGTEITGTAPHLDWVIVGGESGPTPRPMEPDWARGVRDQCRSAGVAFLFKQWGGRTPKANGRLLDGVEHSEFPSPPSPALFLEGGL